MNFETMVRLVRPLPCFDLHLLAQATDDTRSNLRAQLGRWQKAGKIISLRRGMYALADIYRAAPATPAGLAHLLYTPSYLSGLWALAFYDLIPERVVRLTSVTPRVPRTFDNSLGVFEYRNIKQEAFFGYREEPFGPSTIVVAEPEKALLDHWHLSPGEWTSERLEEMRYQHIDVVHEGRLRAFSERFARPRLTRAVDRWLELRSRGDEGTVLL